MNYEVRLNPDSVKKWIKLPNGYVSASAFSGDRLLAESDWIEISESIKTVAQAKELAVKLNGHFAFILEVEEKLFVAMDRQRTIPLFYEMKDGKVKLYDHIGLEDIKEHGIDEDSIRQLTYSLFVSGEKTVAKDILQVMAGECVVFDDNGSCQREYYYTYHYEIKDYKDKEELFGLIDKQFTEVFDRLIKFLDGRRAVIPLSGGHDSRLVLYYLKRLGYDNVITYTYGKKGNFESTTSKKVADYFGVEWHMVEYIPKNLGRLFKRGFKALTDFYTNGVSSVCVQEWYAVNKLFDDGILKKGDVIVPGHSFDAIAGSFILPHYAQKEIITKEELVRDIIYKHYREGYYNLSDNDDAFVRRMIDENLFKNEGTQFESEYAFELYQIYNIRERQAKYTCNAVRMYEYYGKDWYMPLWDNELIEFWETIPIKQKFGRKLFFEFTEKYYKELMRAAPVENLKKKTSKIKNENILFRVLRKIWQLWNYTDFHYCLSYFDRFTVYKVFLKTRILNISYMVNYMIIKILRGERNG